MQTSINFFLLIFIIFSSGIQLSGQQWNAAPEVIGEVGESGLITGTVFYDTNKNGKLDAGEQGISGVLVSNGKDWVRTDENGHYQISVRPDMNLTIVQPSGWRVPTDARMVPQFFYIHKAGGTPYEMRFGGLPDAGPAPSTVNFPLIREGAAGNDFSCVILADPQAYSNEQLNWLRDGVFADILNADYMQGDCMIQLGDIVGDDLGLLERHLELGSVIGLPQWLVIGNHDIDFDARTNEDKADSWRRIYGPNYYAFEMGNVLFVVLDNIYYPCGPEDYAMGVANCAEGNNPNYNGRLTDIQFQWLETLINKTDEDKLIVMNTHIPMVSFVDGTSAQHQTNDAYRIYELLEGREAVFFAGHTHTTENHSPGQVFKGWEENTGSGPLPFRHIIAGAASGAWFQGDFNVYGIPMALQRLGAPMGYFHVDFEGAEYREKYVAALMGRDKGQWIGLNTPGFRKWYNEIMNWAMANPFELEAVPPYSINDLTDTGILTPQDFSEGVWVTANVWAGSAETEVRAVLSTGLELNLERTQDGAGEEVKIGVEWADPFATSKQLSVTRYAYQSQLGHERAQGQELFTGRSLGPTSPRPQTSIADRNMHLWRAQLPELPLGVHTIEVISTDRHGMEYRDKMTVEVRDDHPPLYWRHELWENRFGSR